MKAGCVAVLSVGAGFIAACGMGGEDVFMKTSAGVMTNGAQLNGAQLNGAQLNGVQLNGVQLNGLHTPSFLVEKFSDLGSGPDWGTNSYFLCTGSKISACWSATRSASESKCRSA